MPVKPSSRGTTSSSRLDATTEKPLASALQSRSPPMMTPRIVESMKEASDSSMTTPRPASRAPARASRSAPAVERSWSPLSTTMRTPEGSSRSSRSFTRAIIDSPRGDHHVRCYRSRAHSTRRSKAIPVDAQARSASKESEPLRPDLVELVAGHSQPPDSRMPRGNLRGNIRTPPHASLASLARSPLRSGEPFAGETPGTTEGEGFEPSNDEAAVNGFRDRRFQPLSHPSRVLPSIEWLPRRGSACRAAGYRQAMDEILIVTTTDIPGYEITQVHGEVCGLIV